MTCERAAIDKTLKELNSSLNRLFKKKTSLVDVDIIHVMCYYDEEKEEIRLMPITNTQANESIFQSKVVWDAYSDFMKAVSDELNNMFYSGKLEGLIKKSIQQNMKQI